MPPLLPLILLTLLLAACSPDISAQKSKPVQTAVATFPVEIVTPRVLEGLSVGDLDRSGRPSVVPCRTCHEADAGALPSDAQTLAGPHAGLRFSHGALSCSFCHAKSARDKLHLADGREIPLTDAMTLCSQCHGPQKRDYDHGAHGGMRGYWDLTRGPRQRNHCVACHDPHAPKFGAFAPMPGPRDRFAAPLEGELHD